MGEPLRPSGRWRQPDLVPCAHYYVSPPGHLRNASRTLNGHDPIYRHLELSYWFNTDLVISTLFSLNPHS